MRMRGPHSTFARVFHVILAGHVLVDEEFAYDLGQVGQHSIPVLNGYILNWYIYVYIYVCMYMYIYVYSYICPRSVDPRTIFFWAWDPNAWSNQLRYNYDDKGKEYFNL